MKFSLPKLFRFLLIACAVLFLVVFYQKNSEYVVHVDDKLSTSNIPVINNEQNLEDVFFMDDKTSSEPLLLKDDGLKGNRTVSLSFNATTEVRL